MPNLKFQPVLLAALLVFALLVNSSTAYAIAKCQDTEGKWHYGDSAAAICGDAVITIIDKSGRKVDEIDKPLTLEAINAQKAEEKRKELEQKQRTKREQEKKRILAIYPTEESVIRARDDRLSGMDNNISLQEELLDTMRLDMKALEARELPVDEKEKEILESRKKMQQENLDAFYKAITQLRREREQTAEKYEEILKEFRELTSK
ncbi:MAG: hypothetical protein ACN4GR_15805 [Arenicellales bacterium]